ncbi:MAG: ChbG/HpnK family deacetylase [Nitrospira sp.]|nr:MAG: ChbG/HpnK family deacetylase [Nitrospira sp.]
MRVIINADDFGLNAYVNDRIFDLMSRRCITSATLIANAPAVEEAVRRVPRDGNCSIGVHLNLTEFQPLTPPKDIGILGSCLDQKGCFAGEESLRTAKLTSQLKKAIFTELCLQVEKILSLGVKISHFDSHNHVHTIPALFSVVKRVQRHFGIRKVRTTWNVFPPSYKASQSLILKKRIWDLALRHWYHTVTTSGFTSFAMFYDLVKTTSLNFDSIELMVHPGHLHFEEETQLLYTDWQKIVPFSTELISYRDL